MSLAPKNRDPGLERAPGGFFSGYPISSGSQTPKVDIFETDRDIVLKAELPGVAREDLEVFAEPRSVRLTGETRRSEEYRENHVYHSERYYGSFSRIIPLPAEVRTDLAQADFKDGVLTLSLPKEEKVKPKGCRVEIDD